MYKIFGCFLLLCAIGGRPAMAQNNTLPRQVVIQSNRITNAAGLALPAKAIPDSIGQSQYGTWLLSQLHAQGYWLAGVDSIGADSAKTILYVYAGQQHKQVQVNWQNASNTAGADTFMIMGAKNRVIQSARLPAYMSQTVQRLANQGYPFATLAITEVNPTTTPLSLTIGYNTGPYITFDTLQAQGQPVINALFAGRLMGIAPGAPYSDKRLRQGIIRLNTLPYLQAIQVQKPYFANKKATVPFTATKRKINKVDAVVGLLPNEGAAQQLLLVGRLLVELHNMARKGRYLNVDWQRVKEASSIFKLDYRHPVWAGTLLQPSFSFALLKEDSTFLQRNLALQIGFWPGSYQHLSLGGFWQRNSILQGGAEAPAVQDSLLASTRSVGVGLTYTYNRLNEVLNPRSGIYLNTTINLGQRTLLEQNNALTDSLGSSNGQYKISIGTQYHRPVSSTVGLFLHLRSAILVQDQAVLTDYYRLGGLKTIRGFRENFFFAKNYVLANIEGRLFAKDGSVFFTFIDVAQISTQTNNTTAVGLGLGFTLASKSGVFSLAWAVGQQNSSGFDFQNSKLHFGYQARF